MTPTNQAPSEPATDRGTALPGADYATWDDNRVVSARGSRHAQLPGPDLAHALSQGWDTGQAWATRAPILLGVIGLALIAWRSQPPTGYATSPETPPREAIDDQSQINSNDQRWVKRGEAARWDAIGLAEGSRAASASRWNPLPTQDRSQPASGPVPRTPRSSEQQSPVERRLEPVPRRRGLVTVVRSRT